MPNHLRDDSTSGEPASGISPLRLLILLVLLLPALALGLWVVSLVLPGPGILGELAAKWIVLPPVVITACAILAISQRRERRSGPSRRVER